jgi:hypothetical protein
MISELEMGLAEADERIAEAENNIRQLGSLIPELANQGYATTEVEGHVEQMQLVLDHLHEQRQSIIQNLDGSEAPPRIIQQTVLSGSWREICMRLNTP